MLALARNTASYYSKPCGFINHTIVQLTTNTASVLLSQQKQQALKPYVVEPQSESGPEPILAHYKRKHRCRKELCIGIFNASAAVVAIVSLVINCHEGLCGWMVLGVLLTVSNMICVIIQTIEYIRSTKLAFQNYNEAHKRWLNQQPVPEIDGYRQ